MPQALAASTAFDRTYEGLKLVSNGENKYARLAFDRTYEGLKPALSGRRLWVSMRF